MGDLLNRRISNVGLSVRTYHALEAGGILTVRDLCSRSEADVSVIRGCGAKTLWELKCFLEANGLSFNKEPYRTINIMVPGDVHYRLDTGDQKFLFLPTLNVPVEVGDYFSITEKIRTVTLCCENEVMKGLIDKFGMDIPVKPKTKTHFITKVNVCTSPTFFAWVFQWCGAVKITAPKSVVREYQEMVRNALD